MSAEDKTETKTDVKTLWTETILEILYTALEKNKGDQSIRDILKEVREKGYRQNEIVNKVEKKVGAEAAQRVRRLQAG